jgi:hypothetical protein
MVPVVEGGTLVAWQQVERRPDPDRNHVRSDQERPADAARLMSAYSTGWKYAPAMAEGVRMR